MSVSVPRIQPCFYFSSFSSSSYYYSFMSMCFFHYYTSLSALYFAFFVSVFCLYFSSFFSLFVGIPFFQHFCFCFISRLSCILTVCPLCVFLLCHEGGHCEDPNRAKFMSIASINKHWDYCLWTSPHSIFNTFLFGSGNKGLKMVRFCHRGGCGL